MTISNADIVCIFNRVADLLEIRGANPFRARAYRNAARTVAYQPRSVAEMLREGRNLSELPDIGDTLSAKIAEIVETGTLRMLRRLERKIPPQLTELLRIHGLGPKRVARLYWQLNIVTLDDLAEAARSGKVRRVPGFGEKTEHRILLEIERLQQNNTRTPLAEAEQVTSPSLPSGLTKGTGE